MARKHLLSNIGAGIENLEQKSAPSESRAEYARRGASRSMMLSLDEMAENSMRVLDGETIISLDPRVLDVSPYADRIANEDADFEALVTAIQQAGQASPILVRPHPSTVGRFVIVYGHRRARAAKRLGIPVRAVIKPLQEIAHVIAQGQENTARSNLTFIEKSLFAKKLLSGGIEKATIRSALTIDDTLLSRMLAIAENMPDQILDGLGAAKGIGRDRWEELKKLIQDPSKYAEALDMVASSDFGAVASEDRFQFLLDRLKAKRAGRKAVRRAPAERAWSLADNTVKVATKDDGKAFSLALRSKDASPFGAYIADRLEHLYSEFQKASSTKAEG